MMTAVSFVLLGSFAILIGKMFSRLLQFSPLKVAKPLGQEAHLYVVRWWGEQLKTFVGTLICIEDKLVEITTLCD